MMILFIVNLNMNWLLLFSIFHVEILQMLLMCYCILIMTVFSLVTSLNDMRRFFMFSELMWLCMFCSCIIFGGLTNSSNLYAQALFMLMFTACEAIILASILLLNFEEFNKSIMSSIKM